MIKAEIITIGDEILFGQITDTNTQFISAELDKIGIKTIRKSSVGDSSEAILTILAEANSRADLVLITGGLGPTKDDITKKVLNQYFGGELELHPEALKDVTEFFQKRGRELTEINRNQALLPNNCTFIPNKQGTAPCMWFQQKNTIWVSMPGVPFEMKAIMENEIIPRLQKHFQTPTIVHKVIKNVGIGESYLSELIESWELNLPDHIKLAYLPSYGIVKLRLTAVGADKFQLEKDIQEQIDLVLPLIDKYVYGYDQEELEEVVGKLLQSQGFSVSTAESCTGGYLGHKLTSVPGSSAYYLGGIISYDNNIKTDFLGVDSKILEKHGAVSEETIIQMADLVRKKFGSNFGLATSGIAGPDGGSPEKPVGTIWIALSSEKETITRKLTLAGTRLQNIQLTAISCLDLLRKQL